MNGKEVLEILRTRVSESEYNQYVSKIACDLKKSSESKFVFTTKNAFVLNWVKRKYEKMIIEIIQSRDDITPIIIFILESKVDTLEEQVQKRYLIKNNLIMTNEEQSFDNFIVGETNRFAFESAKGVVTFKARYNPLLIYGNTGLGKTHLLNSICNSVYKKNPNSAIISLSAEAMFNEYKHRINNKNMDQFRERFRKCDYLLIDDVQFLSKTDKFQEEFFNTFNDIIKEGGQIVMTSDKPPKMIEKLEKRLKSRFMGGMNAKIESPELEIKINIIKQKCSQIDIDLSEDIINMVATQIHDNIREIEGMLLNIYGHSKILNMPVTIESVKYYLKDREDEKRNLSINDIVNIIASEYNIKPSDIRTKVRGKKEIAKARKIVAYLAKNEIHSSFPNIANELNLKDHSAVSKQIKAISNEIEKDSKLKIEIKNIISKLRQF